MKNLIIFLLLVSGLFGISDGQETRYYTYRNDMISTTGSVVIVADPQVCTPFMGFIDDGANQTFECAFTNSSQAYNNMIMFIDSIPSFPYFLDIGCFTYLYPDHVGYQNISEC